MYDLIELLAVIASATFGVLLARRHHMDFVGVFSLAFIVSFGGGTLRDLFLDRHPLFWMREHHYPIIVFGIALVTSLIKTMPKRLESYLSLPDALGLGLFSIAGAVAAIEVGTTYFNAALLGVVTGTFGGVIGDVICNRVPSLFRPAPFFATCSFVGCWLFFALRATPLPESYAAGIAIVVIVSFRLVSVRMNLRMPALGIHDRGDTEQES